MKIDIFNAGVHTSNNGVTKEFSNEFLNKIVTNFNENKQDAPITIGHLDNDRQKAYGFINNLELNENTLIADCDFNKEITNMIQNKEYNNISAGFKDDRFTHLAILGAMPPAIDNLKSLSNYNFNMQLSEVFDFAIQKNNKIITIDGLIDYELYDTIKADIKDNDNITIQLFSPGGYASVGVALYNILKTVKNLTVKVYGNTASAATLIALAANKDNRMIAENAEFLVHQGRFNIYYDTLKETDLSDMNNDLKLFNENLLNIYKNETNANEALLKEMIYNEKSISADEAVKLGFFNNTFKANDNELEFSIENENKINTFITNNLEIEKMPNEKENIIDNSDVNEIKDLLQNSITLNKENAKTAQKSNDTIALLKAEIEALTENAKVQKINDMENKINADIDKLKEKVNIENIDNLKELLIENFEKDTYQTILDITQNVKNTVTTEPRPTNEKINKDVKEITEKRDLENTDVFDKAQMELQNAGKTESEAIDILLTEMEA